MYIDGGGRESVAGAERGRRPGPRPHEQNAFFKCQQYGGNVKNELAIACLVPASRRPALPALALCRSLPARRLELTLPYDEFCGKSYCQGLSADTAVPRERRPIPDDAGAPSTPPAPSRAVLPNDLGATSASSLAAGLGHGETCPARGVKAARPLAYELLPYGGKALFLPLASFFRRRGRKRL